MKWTPEAETAIKKIPLLVRKKVRVRLEKKARVEGKKIVSLDDVKTTQARLLSRMGSEIKGFQLKICFGPNGCPNRTNISDQLYQKVETLLKSEDLLSFLKKRVKGDLKFHHEFKITLADCPNACSQPQIKDIGIIGAVLPAVADETCTQCEACLETCQEGAIELDTLGPRIDFSRCLKCGKCALACPTGTLTTDCKGYRIQLGGKLGRHPKIAQELPGLFNEKEVIEIVKACIAVYKKKSTHGQRFAEIFTDTDFEQLKNKINV
ncbi:MAG: 4Fe-4S binding protein [Deltaproteobacteria bacterium]|nr:MAG: 4Fe-4S binding protein [Deltaproteobacteria bacterium]